MDAEIIRGFGRAYASILWAVEEAGENPGALTNLGAMGRAPLYPLRGLGEAAACVLRLHIPFTNARLGGYVDHVMRLALGGFDVGELPFDYEATPSEQADWWIGYQSGPIALRDNIEEDAPPGLISVTDYAAKHGVQPDTVRQKILRGNLRAQKIGTSWGIAADEPYVDGRKK